MSQNAADDYLSTSGAPVAKFPNLGDTHQGTIIDYALQPVTDMQTKEPKFFKSGDPMMQIVATLQTKERDPENPDDDGKRRVFIKGHMLSSFRAATQLAGHTKNLTGGKVQIRYYGDGESSSPGFSGPKLYECKFIAPEPMDAFDEIKTDVYQEPTKAPPVVTPDEAFGDEEPF